MFIQYLSYVIYIYALHMHLIPNHRFLHNMSEIPQFNDRLVCLLYSQTLPESSESIMTELNVYNRLSRELRHSPKVPNYYYIFISLIVCVFTVVANLGYGIDSG